jgi:hypothetical protein
VRKGPRIAACALFLAAAATVAGCRETDPGYFPLEEGWSWGYRVVVDTKNLGKATYRSYVANLPRQALDESQVTPRLVHDGRVYYYTEEAGGIRRVASRAGEDGTALAAPGHYVLKRPLEPGNSWRVASESHLLRRQVFYTRGLTTLKIAAGLELRYTIEAVDDVVTVPRGTFTRCLRIRGVGETTYDLGHPFKTITIEVESTEWFAPGVGLVKLVRRENTRPANLFSAEMVQELEVFDRDTWLD